MKKSIITMPLAHFKNETHVQFHETINAFFAKQSLENLGLIPLYTPYKGALDKETQALDFIRKSELTVKIDEQDHLRDRIYRSFFDMVKGASNHFDEARREDGRILYDIFKHYGNIAKKTLDDETAAINDLIRELDTEEFSIMLMRLNLNDWLGKLREANNAFEKLMIDRYTETAQKTPYRMVTARVETDRYYHAMIHHIENLALVTPEVVEDFIRELNAVIARFKAIEN